MKGEKNISLIIILNFSNGKIKIKNYVLQNYYNTEEKKVRDLKKKKKEGKKGLFKVKCCGATD